MNSPFAKLAECESKIDDVDELQWRQVHPRFVDGDVVSQEAFVGTPGATDEVSSTRSSGVTAAQAYAHFVNVLELSSAGTWAVTVGEVEHGGARCVDDAGCEGQETPAHSYLDLRHLSKAQRKAVRAHLAAAATARGCQHR